MTFIAVINWLVPAMVGAIFTFVGCLKLCGLFMGIVGGEDKPALTRLCGT